MLTVDANGLFSNATIPAGGTAYTGTAPVVVAGSVISVDTAKAQGKLATFNDILISKPYKIYIALIDQAGTAAPTATILENTIGTVTLARSAVGLYTVSNALFVLGKTVSLISGAGTPGNMNVYSAYNNAAGAIQVTTHTNSVSSDGVLLRSSIEIRVYN